jgi:fructan beta-fructosidase
MRPTYHFTARQHWLNDPNGLVYWDGEYHLFYQFNPHGITHGNMSWGHAVSTDLVRWTELEVAIPFTEGVQAFSGSAFVDWRNSSGFGDGTNPPLVAAFTGHTRDPRREDQRLAYSTDRGQTWTLYVGNPVLDIGATDFRDPKVFWHAPSGRWVMAVVMAHEHQVGFYGSSDFKTWAHLSDFGPYGSTDGIWEVPDIMELPVEGSSQTRWVLKVDIGKGAPNGGSLGQYFVGDFDGTTFTPDAASLETAPNWLDGGKDFYAAIAYSDAPERRKVWLGWMSNWQYAYHTPTSPWRGAMTIPRDLALRRVGNTHVLVQRPIPELETLRRTHQHVNDATLEGERLLESASNALEVQLRLEPRTALEVGLNLGSGNRLGYDVARGMLFVERASQPWSEEFGGRHEVHVPLENGALEWHIFLDACSIEVFADDGAVVFTDLLFDLQPDGFALYAEGGAAHIASLEWWTLEV